MAYQPFKTFATNQRKIAADKQPSYDWRTGGDRMARSSCEHKGGTHASPTAEATAQAARRPHVGPALRGWRRQSRDRFS